MKNFLISILLTVLCFTVSGQKVKNDNLDEWFFIQIPANYALEGAETFNVEGIGANADAYRRDRIEKVLRGYPISRDFNYNSSGDVTLKVEEYPLKFSEHEAKTKETSTKDKDGNVVKTKEYYYIRTVTYNYVLEIINSEGETIYTKSWGADEVITGPANKSRTVAFDGFKTVNKEWMDKVIEVKVKKLLLAAEEELGYVGKKIRAWSLHVKPKKFDYPEFDVAHEKMLEALAIREESGSEEADWDKIDTLLDLVIEEMQKALKESDPENKKARINKGVSAAAYYNIGVCYFIQQKYKEADENFGKAIGIQKGVGNAKTFKPTTEKMLNRMAIRDN